MWGNNGNLWLLWYDIGLIIFLGIVIYLVRTLPPRPFWDRRKRYLSRCREDQLVMKHLNVPLAITQFRGTLYLLCSEHGEIAKWPGVRYIPIPLDYIHEAANEHSFLEHLED